MRELVRSGAGLGYARRRDADGQGATSPPKPKGPRSEGSGGLKVEIGSVLEGRSTELFIVRALRLCFVRALRLCAVTYTPIRAA
jgi:hypothetical protein